MDEVKVHIEVEVNPTESEDKVKKAVENFFGNIALKIRERGKGRLLVAEDQGRETLDKLYELLRKEQICNAARGILFGGLHGDTIRFSLNKQAAYAGHISFSTNLSESPLGPIEVQLMCKNPRKVINWLAPKMT